MDEIELCWINITIKSNNRIFYCSIRALYLQQCKQSFFITAMEMEFNLKLNVFTRIYIYNNIEMCT